MSSIRIGEYSYPEITDSVIHQCIDDIEFFYDNGYIKPNSPHQTADILFDSYTNPRWDKHWDLLRETFIHSAEKYSQSKFSLCKGWVFACFEGKEISHQNWHIHQNASVSGIMYLSLPDGCETTEFRSCENTTFFLPKRTSEWFVFDKNYVHRPGSWDHTKIVGNRFCLAGSVR